LPAELKHPNIITSDWMRKSPEYTYIRFPYYTTDLYNFVRTSVPTQKQIQTFLKQLTDAVNYCHNNGVFHRDIKTRNILVDIAAEQKIILADFGLACRFTQKDGQLTYLDKTEPIPCVATLNYRALEVVLQLPYTLAIDVWSIGCVFAEMYMRDNLLETSDELKYLDKMFSILGPPTEDYPSIVFKDLPPLEQYHKVPLESKIPNMPPSAIDLLTKMLLYNPQNRIQIVDILKHEYFNIKFE